MPSQHTPRPIRSYVRRKGHITPGQERALKEVQEHRLTIQPQQSSILWRDIFNRETFPVLEIGFGMGDALLDAAQSNPDMDFIGVDVHPPGIGRCLLAAQRAQLSNVRVCQSDVNLILPLIPANSLDQVWLYFPDPWPKTRHHKRRIVQMEFVLQIARILRPSGTFRLATDWENYAEHMMDVLSVCPAFKNVNGPGQYAPSAEAPRPKTKFERRGEQLGHAIWDLCFEKV